MNPSDYQKAAGRTESDPFLALRRVRGKDDICPDIVPIRVLHALLGLSGEVGELSEAVKKWLYYGKPLDAMNIKEELGDVLWYMALLCNTLSLDLWDVMEANIRKLKVRYPEKFTEEKALKRDTAAEIEAVNWGHEWVGAPLTQCALCGEFKASHHDKPCDSSKLDGKMEPCCECGRDYPLSDLIRGYVFCAVCRSGGE